jgi:hypothetical protein
MTEPAMLILGEQPASLGELRATLDRRYRLVLSRRDRFGLAAMLDTGGAEFLAITQRLNPLQARLDSAAGRSTRSSDSPRRSGDSRTPDDLPGRLLGMCQWLSSITWGTFVIDFVVRLSLAGRVPSNIQPS